jgi:hypothetical protein
VAKINIKPEISDIKLSDIKPAPYNPREISNEAMSGLRHSLEKFGYVDLMVVNKRNMRVISGHQRYKILQAEGVETVTAILVDVDEIQEQAMNVTLNNQEIAGYWTAALIPLLERLRNEAVKELSVTTTSIVRSTSVPLPSYNRRVSVLSNSSCKTVCTGTPGCTSRVGWGIW